METVENQDFIIINEFNPSETPKALKFTGSYEPSINFRGMSGVLLLNFTSSAVVITFQSPSVISSIIFKISFIFDDQKGIV